ncbi:MAG: MBL fold metallo-hydrolase [Alphaproteobacteria bacterium]|nr:MBL fold metallo-hydrolase [Alphaproteobacteria bacterium]
MRPRMLGEISLARVLESEGPYAEPTNLLPDATPENLAPHMDWLQPRVFDPATGMLVLAVQSYVVRTRHHTILIDTCVGEEKERYHNASWNMRRDTRYLADLAAMGLAPEDIDFVMCTHLHPDHVGWNTRLVDGRWVPTFPNAKYVFSQTEYDFWEPKAKRDNRKFGDGAIGDSVFPVVEAGQALMVATDHALDDEVWLEPSPGHTPGHVSIRLASGGEEAVMSGDLIHSPIQCAEPDWCTVACFDKDQARATRRAFLEDCAETGRLALTAHFPSPSIGRFTRQGEVYRFLYDGEEA